MADKAKSYVELGKKWAAGHTNRMIKVPATPGGLAALEELAAAEMTINVTLIFSHRQYDAARDAIWRGAEREQSLEPFKSVYSIFISRIDVYTKQHVPQLSPQAQGEVGIVNVKRLWEENQEFWNDKEAAAQAGDRVRQHGDERPERAAGQVRVGAGRLRHPDESRRQRTRPFRPCPANGSRARSIIFPPADVLAEIDKKVDFNKLEEVLMEEGLKKFADPQKALFKLIAEKREKLGTA